MARVPRGGRPSKGDRDQFVTRLPRSVGERVRQQLEDSDLSISDWIAALIAREVGMSEMAPMPASRTGEQLSAQLATPEGTPTSRSPQETHSSAA